MLWQKPKTDWKSNDYFNIEDYGRMTGNLTYLQELAGRLYEEFPLADMAAITNYSDYIYAEDFNAIEQNLTAIGSNIYPMTVSGEKTYSANNRTPDYAEFNRIESLLLEIYNNLTGQLAGKRRLSFTLGGGGVTL